jgi:tetratricopeptide (TPR) repeat protein
MVNLVPGPVHGEQASLGEALQRYYRSDYRGAIGELKEVIAEDPDNAAAFYYLGYIYQEMEMYPAARAAFKKTYDINPDFVPTVPQNPRSE